MRVSLIKWNINWVGISLPRWDTTEVHRAVKFCSIHREVPQRLMDKCSFELQTILGDSGLYCCHWWLKYTIQITRYTHDLYDVQTILCYHNMQKCCLSLPFLVRSTLLVSSQTFKPYLVHPHDRLGLSCVLFVGVTFACSGQSFHW